MPRRSSQLSTHPRSTAPSSPAPTTPVQKGPSQKRSRPVSQPKTAMASIEQSQPTRVCAPSTARKMGPGLAYKGSTPVPIGGGGGRPLRKASRIGRIAPTSRPAAGAYSLAKKRAGHESGTEGCVHLRLTSSTRTGVPPATPYHSLSTVVRVPCQ